MLKVCIVGAGNISNSRHIPAILKNKKITITGVVSDDEKKIARTMKAYPEIKSQLCLDGAVDIEQMKDRMESCAWFMDSVDAVIIGTPPRQHYPLTKVCLLLGKHVLVEKPMMLSVEECQEVNEIARQNGLILYVNHSFQYANGITKLEEKLTSGDLGELNSILEIQLTNRNRRLPIWYNDLPLGLFYDEAAHFFYSAIRFGNGPIQVLNANAVKSKKKENTPLMLEVQLTAGQIPVQMYMNFNSPICEWGLILLCEKKIAVYDFFKDILVTMDNDNLHLAKDVLHVSGQFFLKYWRGFIANGLKMVSKNLLYGHDRTMESFRCAIESGYKDPYISGELGQSVVKAMNEVVSLVERT